MTEGRLGASGWGVVIYERVLHLRCAAPGLPDGSAVPRGAMFSTAVYWAAGGGAAHFKLTAGGRSAECGGAGAGEPAL